VEGEEKERVSSFVPGRMSERKRDRVTGRAVEEIYERRTKSESGKRRI
jgi:hypothetical protein